MLLILMYHRAGGSEAGTGNTPEVLADHFRYLRQHAVITLPGELLQPHRINVCLTFDDAYADFYFRVFPLLQEFSLRALLAVPTRYILESSRLSPESRLAVIQSDAMREEVYQSKAPFCTWEELRQMSGSGLVQVVSHSHSHPDMRLRETDVEFEAVHSQMLITKNLGSPATAFVYPYGRVNGRARQAVRKHYDFDLRIGAALNFGWYPRRQPLCRVSADDTFNLAPIFQWNNLAGLGLKAVGNQVRAIFGKWGV